LGVVFQHPEDQLFCPTVKDDVAFGPRNLGVPEAEIAVRVETALRDVGLAGQGDRVPQSLSGGQKRRAAIATVLAMSPRVWLFDEPTADLDPRSRRELCELLKTIPGTKLIASHDLDFVLDTCRQVAVLAEGKLQTLGPTETVLAHEKLMNTHGLEVPWRLRAKTM
jgi:cobalt/nickel transport system ATP-binding protein